MTRIRSPNYPQISLAEAVDLARTIHKEEAQNFAPRSVIAELLGYSSVNGASERKTSALNAYGLVERNEDRELRITDLAIRILFPHDESEKGKALAEAAMSPNLFRELREKWKEAAPSDANLKAYLIRRGFNQNAVDSVVSMYRDALRFAEVERSVLESGPDEPDATQERPAMQANQAPTPTNRAPGATKPIVFDTETISGQYSFDNADDLEDFIEKLERIKPLLPKKN